MTQVQHDTNFPQISSSGFTFLFSFFSFFSFRFFFPQAARFLLLFVTLKGPSSAGGTQRLAAAMPVLQHSGSEAASYSYWHSAIGDAHVNVILAVPVSDPCRSSRPCSLPARTAVQQFEYVPLPTAFGSMLAELPAPLLLCRQTLLGSIQIEMGSILRIY